MFRQLWFNRRTTALLQDTFTVRAWTACTWQTQGGVYRETLTLGTYLEDFKQCLMWHVLFKCYTLCTCYGTIRNSKCTVAWQRHELCYFKITHQKSSKLRVRLENSWKDTLDAFWKRHSQTCTLSKTHILPCILIHNATAKRIWWKRRSILCIAVCFFYIKKNWFGYFLFYFKNQINKTESTELFIEKLFSSTLTFQGKE